MIKKVDAARRRRRRRRGVKDGWSPRCSHLPLTRLRNTTSSPTNLYTAVQHILNIFPRDRASTIVPAVTMSSTRIHHNISRIPITSTLLLVFANYELWRIHKGTHPYWTPKLEEAGILRRRNKTTSNASASAVGSGAEATGESPGVSIQWMNLNGVPIPFIKSPE